MRRVFEWDDGHKYELIWSMVEGTVNLDDVFPLHNGVGDANAIPDDVIEDWRQQIEEDMASLAAAALAMVPGADCDDPEWGGVVDLMASLMHYCHREGIIISEVVDQANCRFVKIGDKNRLMAQATAGAICLRCLDRHDGDLGDMCRPCIAAVNPVTAGLNPNIQNTNGPYQKSHPFRCHHCGNLTTEPRGRCGMCYPATYPAAVIYQESPSPADSPKGAAPAPDGPQIRLKGLDKPSWEFLGPPL